MNEKKQKRKIFSSDNSLKIPIFRIISDFSVVINENKEGGKKESLHSVLPSHHLYSISLTTIPHLQIKWLFFL